jgi:hypothetical protein
MENTANCELRRSRWGSSIIPSTSLSDEVLVGVDERVGNRNAGHVRGSQDGGDDADNRQESDNQLGIGGTRDIGVRR